MSETPDPQAAEPVAEPVETPVAEAPAAEEAATPAEEPVEAAAEPTEGAAEPEKPEPPKKSPVAQLQGRVGHLTKVVHQKDETISEQARQLEAYKALLESQGRTGDAPTTPNTPAQPLPGTKEFDALVQTEAQKVAARAQFTADCDAIYEAGEKAHGEEFKEAITNLNAMGMINEQVVLAAMASGAAAEVLHHLGSDIEEAARVTALPPIKMAAELTKLATKLSAKPTLEISKAPAPIKPVGSTATVEPNIYDPKVSGNMAEYARIREAQGASWARQPKPRF